MSTKGIAAVRMGLKRFADDSHVRGTRAVFAILNEGAALSDTYTPVDTSNLLNSRYQPQVTATKGKISGVVGYTAEYAAWVHEMSGKLKGQPRADFGKTRDGVAFGGGTGKGNYWDPHGKPRFLAEAFEEIKPDIPTILQRIYRV